MCQDFAAVGRSWGLLQPSPAPAHSGFFPECLQQGCDSPGRIPAQHRGDSSQGFAVNPHKGNLGSALISQKWGLSGVTDLSHRVFLALAGVWALQLKSFVCRIPAGPSLPYGNTSGLLQEAKQGPGEDCLWVEQLSGVDKSLLPHRGAELQLPGIDFLPCSPSLAEKHPDFRPH